MMIDFRNYKDLIRNSVSLIDKQDENWKWSVENIKKGEVKIRWSYLDDEPRNCFFLTFSSDPTDKMCDCCIDYRRPDYCLLDGIGVGGDLFPEVTPEKAIALAIRNIARYAHNTY